MHKEQENKQIELMQKEIRLMQEVLSNLLLEETLLRHQDQNARQKLKGERFSMLKTIEDLRKTREESSLEFSSCEILLLKEQLSRLCDQTSKQANLNQSLIDQHPVAFSSSLPYTQKCKPKSQLLLMDEKNS